MDDLWKAQLAYAPEPEGGTLDAHAVVCGAMGGSAFPGRVATFLGIPRFLSAHCDYGLPDAAPAGAAYLAVSHSGNTEETLSFAEAALERGLPLGAIASGGALLALAEDRALPRVRVPSGAQPRDSVVSVARALLALVKEPDPFPEHAADTALVHRAAAAGERLAEGLAGGVPVFYASTRNGVIASLGKVLMNETAKVPAFANAFPELNHNEMQGWSGGVPALNASFVAVFVGDPTDDPRIARRSVLTQSLLEGAGVRKLRLDLPEGPRAACFLYAWWALRTAAWRLAAGYGTDPVEVPLIERFKRDL